jgi:hypothetical protein
LEAHCYGNYDGNLYRWQIGYCIAEDNDADADDDGVEWLL